MISTIKKTYKVPVSLITDDMGTLEVYFKHKNQEDKINQIDKVIKEFIEDKKQQADINGLYNALFELDIIFTFKAKYKDLLAGNNIHIQIIT